METIDVTTFRQKAIKLGLVTNDQFEEVCGELGERNPPLKDVLRLLERKAYLTPWQSGRLLKGEADGFFVGGYRVLYKIASGSFGRVLRAEDPATGRIVAVKVLRQKWRDSPEQIEKFAREGKVGLSLKHENIVEVLAVSQDPTTRQHYIVMEFVEGGNLREILQINKKLEVGKALGIIEDATCGLAYAYSRGVTHRDIKLTNILISSQGAAKLVDFGLAQFYAGSNRDEKRRVDRTVDYAGLERATGVEKGDVRSDIFFLGCVLYELLSGRPPIQPSHNRNASMSVQRFRDIPPLPTEEAAAPPSVFALVETMLSLDPVRRFQTPSQLLEAVRAARRDVDGKSAGPAATRSLFLVESDERLQDKLRDGFKELGYRVLLSADPTRALDRYRQQPFDALIVDARTAGDDGRLVFQQILADAGHKRLSCVGILIISQEQTGWLERIPPAKNLAVLVRPESFSQLRKTLDELFEAAE
jgi:serine/threonine protein kinase